LAEMLDMHETRTDGLRSIYVYQDWVYKFNLATNAVKSIVIQSANKLRCHVQTEHALNMSVQWVTAADQNILTYLYRDFQ
jgi:hypothetical protein